MKKISLLLFSLVFSQIVAQPNQRAIDQEVLFTVETDTVTAGEYIAVYNKNRNLGEDIDPKTPEEYLDLYINFKLKVHNAKKLGMHTDENFINEYTSYRNQLAKPYLSDRDVTGELIREAYNRMKLDVRAAHILMPVPEESSEIDAEKAKAKVLKLRERAMNGEEFGKLAREYSADTYSAKRDGDLGYFTAFNMLYPFESAAYNLKVGEISEPIRTKFGYHIVKKLAERPARGMVDVSHIMVIDNEETDTQERQNAEQKINEIYAELENGGNFGEMARIYSNDKNSAQRNGVLPPFGINKMFPEFEEVAFSLQTPGDYSKPFKTPIGWHIVKLNAKEGIPDFKSIERELKNKVERDSRSEQSHESIIKRLKLEYGFKEYPEVKKMVFDQVDKSFLQRQFDSDKILNRSKVLFEFANKKYTVGEFATHLTDAQQRLNNPKNLRLELERVYNKYTEARLIAYEKSRLEKKYPEFRLLAREYYEGILLFNLTEDMVWRKSVSDTVGLQAFYEKNKDNYKWETRYDATVISASSKKMAKQARKMLKSGKTPEEITTVLNAESQLNISLDTGVFEKSSKAIFLQLDPKEGLSDIEKIDGQYQFAQVKSRMEPQVKKLEEARGLVISDYQNHLEKEWIAQLKEEYDVDINEDILKKVITILEDQG